MYCTLEQLTDRYGSAFLVDLTDRADMATGEIDEDVVNRAIADTEALINGYLKRRYKMPLSSVPPLLTDLALQISIYKLHAHGAADKIKDDYKDALRILGDISTGKIRLDVEGNEPEGSGAAGVRITDRERPMTEGKLKGYI